MVNLKVVHASGKYQDETAYKDVLKYCTNPQKTPSNLIAGRNIDIDYAADEMETVAHAFEKNTGVKLRHSVLSFPSRFTADDVDKIARQATDYYADEYQILYAVHEGTEHPHAHIVMNQVSFQDGHRYRGTKQDYYAWQAHIKKILEPYGAKLTVLEE